MIETMSMVAAPTHEYSPCHIDSVVVNKAILEALDASQDIIFISEKPKPRKQKKREGKKLIMLEPEELVSEGECPGGRYFYIEDMNRMIDLLQSWTDKKAWAAIDIETGTAYREKDDPESDDKIRYYEDVIDPYVCPIYLVSISVEPGVSVVFDMRKFRNDDRFLDVWKRFLTECRLIAHGCSFEHAFFMAQFGVVANIVYDTMLVHQLMTAGADISSRLGELMVRYCGVKMDKEWQKFFLDLDHRSPLANEAIAYSAGDVCQLLPLAKKLDQELKNSGLYEVWSKYERPLMRWLPTAKVEGIAVDVEFFTQLSKECTTEMQKIIQEFYVLCPNVMITSTTQVKKWFNSQGVRLRSSNKETLEKYEDVPVVGPVAKLILAYRKLLKMHSTYILPMIRKYPSPATGRIHPNWGQLFTTTGRYNCNDPTVQNIPARDEWVKLRQGFIAKPGHLLVYCDYSQFEVRAMGDMSDEDRMIEVFKEAQNIAKALVSYCSTHNLPENITDYPSKYPEKYAEIVEQHPDLPDLIKALANCDFHRRTASMLFGVPVEEVTKDQRTKAKTITFAKPYGAGPRKISKEAGIPIEEARSLFEDYDEKFPKLAKFLKDCRELGKKGFTTTPSGRRRFYQLPNIATLLQKVRGAEKAQGNEWEDYVETWGTNDSYEIAKKIFTAKAASIEREAMNHPIQGCNADATKLSTIMAGPRLEELSSECKIIMWVHDEIVLTAPEHLAEQAADILRECMIEAAESLLKKTPVDVSVTIGKCWGK